MQNELSSIGMIICELRRGVVLTELKTDKKFLAEEFRKITTAIFCRWSEKGAGALYLLEFHKWETSRLMDELYKLDSIQCDLMETSSQNAFLHKLYVEMILHLTDLLGHIEGMGKTGEMLSKPFELN